MMYCFIMNFILEITFAFPRFMGVSLTHNYAAENFVVVRK